MVPPAAPVLVVDLDGTLIKTDLLVETAIALLKRSPFSFPLLAVWLARGKANLKEQIAERAEIDAGIPSVQQGVPGLPPRRACSGTQDLAGDRVPPQTRRAGGCPSRHFRSRPGDRERPQPFRKGQTGCAGVRSGAERVRLRGQCARGSPDLAASPARAGRPPRAGRRDGCRPPLHRRTGLSAREDALVQPT